MAEEAKPEFTFAFHGFLGGSVYVQDGIIGPGNGGQALYGTTAPNEDRFILGGDVRQNRLNLSLAGPKVLAGATPKGVVEVDFFNLNGWGSFGDVSIMPRMRLAYGELNWGNTILRFGQDHELLTGNAPGPAAAPPLFPTSVGHIAFPLTYTAGELGWREPGVAIYHNIPVGDMWLEGALQVQRPEWRAPLVPAATGTGVSAQLYPDNNNPTLSAGEYSGAPGIEARIRAATKMWQVFLAGHWNHVDRSGFGQVSGETSGPQECTTQQTYGARCKDLDVVAGQAGLKVAYGPVTLQGIGYVGKNLAPLIGDLLQFQANDVGDIHEWGAWGQLGFNFTKEMSAWALYGTSHPTYADILFTRTVPTAAAAALTRLQNSVFSGMLRYQEGGYAIGLEYAYWLTRTTVSGPGPATAPNPSFPRAADGDLKTNQLMLSGFYFF